MHALPKSDPSLLGLQVTLSHPTPFIFEGYSPPIGPASMHAIEAVDVGQHDPGFAFCYRSEGSVIISRAHAQFSRPDCSERLAHLKLDGFLHWLQNDH
jgi:hypothetical protein